MSEPYHVPRSQWCVYANDRIAELETENARLREELKEASVLPVHINDDGTATVLREMTIRADNDGMLTPGVNDLEEP